MANPTNILRHERFQSVATTDPIKRRRGRLPRGVVPFSRTVRLKLGVVAELVGFITGAEDNGKRVRIIDYRPNEECATRVESLDGPVLCDDGTTTLRLWVKPKNLRRLWTGLTNDERLKLSFLKGVSHG